MFWSAPTTSFRFWPLYISVTLDCSYTTSDEQSQLIWEVFSLSFYRSLLHLLPTLETSGDFLLKSFWLQTGWKEHRCLLKEYPGTTILLWKKTWSIAHRAETEMICNYINILFICFVKEEIRQKASLWKTFNNRLLLFLFRWYIILYIIYLFLHIFH